MVAVVVKAAEEEETPEPEALELIDDSPAPITAVRAVVVKAAEEEEVTTAVAVVDRVLPAAEAAEAEAPTIFSVALQA